MINVTNAMSTASVKGKDGREMMTDEFPLTEAFKELLLTFVSKNSVTTEDNPNQNAGLADTLVSQENEGMIKTGNATLTEEVIRTEKSIFIDDGDQLGNIGETDKSEKDKSDEVKSDIEIQEENLTYPHPVIFDITANEPKAGQTTIDTSVLGKEISGIFEKTESPEFKVIKEIILETSEKNDKPLYEIVAEVLLDEVSPGKVPQANAFQLEQGNVKPPMGETTILKGGPAQLDETIRIGEHNKPVVFTDSLEVHMESEKLGKIIIKASLDQGGSNISIACENRRTMEIMALNVKEIGGIIEQNLGAPTTIFVEKGEDNYLNQENGNQGRNDEENQENLNKRKRQDEDSQDFLQQLRLGLIYTEIKEVVG